MPQLVVLGLLSRADRHGYEIEERVEQARMRIWAKVGMSSIYKALNDLEQSGFVSSTSGASRRGPSKKVFSITRSGRSELRRLTQAALDSRTPMYSQRVVGLVHALQIGGKSQLDQVRACRRNLKQGLSTLEAERARASGRLAGIVIDLYVDLMGAELRAVDRVLRAFRDQDGAQG